MSGALLALGLIGMVCGVWNFVCNEWTFRDRTALIKIVFAGPDWREKKILFEQVSYRDHLRHRFFLLNPFRLYHESLLEDRHAAQI